MRSRLRYCIVTALALLVLLAPMVRGDFVRTSRASTIKEQPNGDATVLLRPDIGADFILESGVQTNGYYHVRLPGGGLGWIYRTLVRRFPGTPDNQPTNNSTIITGTFPVSADSMVAHFIDVGQGASTLLEFSCGAILIDTGGEQTPELNSNTNLRTYLDAFFQRRQDLNNTINLLVLSHPHLDHTRGVPEVLSRYTVRSAVDDTLLTGSGSAQQRQLQQFAANSNGVTTYQGITTAAITSTDGITSATIDPVACTGTNPRVRALWGASTTDPGWPSGEMGNENNHSVVLRLDFGESSFLFTGDLQEAGIETLLSFYQGSTTLDVDVWQVGHHGSHNATTQALLQAITPQVAVISMGNKDLSQGVHTAYSYAHPRDVAMDLLTNSGFGVTGFRSPTVTVPIGEKGACNSCTPKRPPVFMDRTIDRAIYGIGWDRTVRLSARANGELRVETGSQ